MEEEIKAYLKDIRETIPDNVTLIAVSKTYPPGVIEIAYRAGQRIFGENKALELSKKQAVLSEDIEWHFIGHLQTNKIKYIAPFVKLIHSVDTINLLTSIDKEAKKYDRIIDCLLQFHIGKESTKFGMNREEAQFLLESEEYKSLKNTRIVGVMGMATFTDDIQQIRLEFRNLYDIFVGLKSQFFNTEETFTEISMGMSDDYRIAIEEGSTMVRIGSAIFGKRQ